MKSINVLFLMMLSSAMVYGGGFQQIYVDSDFRGISDGSSDNPFSSFVEVVRELDKFTNDVKVIFRPGDYFAGENGVILNGERGRRIIFMSEKYGKARLLGGIRLDSDSFVKVEDLNILNRLGSDVRRYVRVYDLSGLDLELSEFPDAYQGTPPAPWLYFDGQPMTLARWPNAGLKSKSWVTFVKATDNGLPDPTSDNPLLRKKHPGSFIFDDPRPERWNIEAGVWLMGYWTHDWSESVIKIADYNPGDMEVKLAGIHGYGIAAGTWGRKERRFFAQNLLEELDIPGEWYIDRKNKKLYFYPPASLKENDIYLATLNKPIISISNSEDIVIDGFFIGYGHNKGANLSHTKNVLIKNCIIADLGGVGISVRGYSNTVTSCECYNIGRSAVSLNGGDRKLLARAGNKAINNHIHDYALFQKTYAPGIAVSGCGQIVRNNLIHHAPHNAILYSGNEHLFEFNEIHHVVLETGDSGAFYTGRDWGSQGSVLRYNYIHDLGLGDKANANTMGIYLDDCDSGDTLCGNVLVNVGRGFMIGGGRDNVMINNIVYNCIIGMSLDARGEKRIVDSNQKGHSSWQLLKKLEQMNYTESPWKDEYPNLANIMNDSPKQPLHNVISNNVFMGCSRAAIVSSVPVEILKKLLIADNITDSGINASKEILGFKKVNNKYSLHELIKKQNIPFEKIGLQK